MPEFEVNTTINGRISAPGEVDRYEVAVNPGRDAVAPALNERVVHPFAVILPEDGSTPAAAGSSGLITGEVARVAPFAGKVDIKVGGLLAGLSAKPLTVDSGASDFRIDLIAGDGLAAGDYTMSVEATTSLEEGKKRTAVVHSIPPVPVRLKVRRERVRIETGIP